MLQTWSTVNSDAKFTHGLDADWHLLFLNNPLHKTTFSNVAE